MSWRGQTKKLLKHTKLKDGITAVHQANDECQSRLCMSTEIILYEFVLLELILKYLSIPIQ